MATPIVGFLAVSAGFAVAAAPVDAAGAGEGVAVLVPQPATVATKAPATARVINFFKVRPSLKGVLFIIYITYYTGSKHQNKCNILMCSIEILITL
jgi:hypothetical protein